jgi:cytochrome P450
MTKELKQAPGPTGLTAYKYLNMFRLDQFEFWREMSANYGEIARMKAAGLTIYVISNPKHIRYVFSENSANYRKSFLYNEIKHVLGNGLLTNEGESWKRARRIVQPVFKKSNIASLVPLIIQSANESVASIDTFKGKSFDVGEEMMKLTF